MTEHIDVDHAVGLAFKFAHRMRAAQVAAGWDSWSTCTTPSENIKKALKNRVDLFVEFLLASDQRGLSSYALRADALETAIIGMEGVIARTRIAFQAQLTEEGISEQERTFVRKTKDYMSGKTVCDNAQALLEQMIDVQLQIGSKAVQTVKHTM